MSVHEYVQRELTRLIDVAEKSGEDEIVKCLLLAKMKVRFEWQIKKHKEVDQEEPDVKELVGEILEKIGKAEEVCDGEV